MVEFVYGTLADNPLRVGRALHLELAGYHAARRGDYRVINQTDARAGMATQSAQVADWWQAGTTELLVIQPADDAIAPPENAHRLLAAVGQRASMVAIPDAGHALLPEQPQAVADAVLIWLRGLDE